MDLPNEYLNILRALKTSLLEIDMMYYSGFTVEEANKTIENMLGYGGMVIEILHNENSEYQKNTERLAEFKTKLTEFENSLFQDIIPKKL